MSTTAARLAAALAGRYRIERELGQGGMATVYLARDLKHDRDVAIKVLKPELAAVLGAERFIVEIKTTAALQHPHILPLFDSGEADGFLYYVMPFIDGETLRAKLDRETQLGVDEAVRLTTDVADALHYAHEQGVIHRDIKPENILLHKGRPMVADFGIALALSAAAGGRMTETGLSLGTPHYMSPEQATAAKDITGRSDVYSLASVLYEMLAGNPPHTGASAQQIIMKIITEQPQPVTQLRKSVPRHVAAALAQALEKLPADRFASAKAFAEALHNPLYDTRASQDLRAGGSRSLGWRERLLWPLVGLSAALMLSIVWVIRRPPVAPPVARYAVELPQKMRLGATQWSAMAVSPDGSMLVYVGENGSLFVRSRDQLVPREIAGTGGASNPFFSPDGTRVGYMSGNAGSASINVVSLAGAPPVTVTSTGVGGPGAAWGSDGYIYFDATGVGPLKRVRDTGGATEAVSVLDSAAGELQHNWPDVLPNGRGVIVTIDRGGPGVHVTKANDIAILDLATRKHHVVARGVFARYASSGHLLYVTATGVLMAVPFDQTRLDVTGAPFALIEGISIRRGNGAVDLAISRTGTLWYSSGSGAGQREVVWASTNGASTPVDSGWVGDFGTIALAPNGKRLAISIADASGQQIWIKQLDEPQRPLSKLTFEYVNKEPRWHPDGSRVLFVSSFAGGEKLRAVRADGSSATPSVLLSTSLPVWIATWSPDGRWLVYASRATGKPGATSRDIYGMQPGLDSTSIPLVSSAFDEGRPSISPDGRWLLYESDATGVPEVYVRPFPNSAASLTQVSTGGGSSAKWSRDGHAIFYADGTRQLVRASVQAGATLAIGERRVLFALTGVYDWDVAPDGVHFIMVRSRSSQDARTLVVVEQFFQELLAKGKP